MTKNEKAFLDMLAYSEGTEHHGDNGYNVLVGGGLFHGYATHPGILVKLPRLGIASTAAGRYQILKKNYYFYAKLLKLPDFGPASQDAIALQLIDECNARADINSGKLSLAITKCASRWASLPGAGYGQRENTYKNLRTAYLAAGGALTESHG